MCIRDRGWPGSDRRAPRRSKVVSSFCGWRFSPSAMVAFCAWVGRLAGCGCRAVSFSFQAVPATSSFP
eukprot:9308295-Alexandrium_andersonii.AAC.1